MTRNCLIWFIASAVVICICKAKKTDIGRLKIKLNKLTRKQDALQNEVDDIWAFIVTSGTQKQDNKAKTDDLGTNSQELISKVDGKLTTKICKDIQIGATEEKNDVRQSMRELHEHNQHESNKVETENKDGTVTTKICKYIRIGVTEEKNDFKQSIRELHENNEHELNNIETENKDLRSIIDEMQKYYQKMQSRFEAENQALKDAIREMQTDNYNMKRGLTKCDDSWEGFNGHCYLVVLVRKKWKDASAFCGSKSSYLIEITTDQELEFATELMRKTLGSHGFWIGATDKKTNGTFVYQKSKRPVPENYWSEGQPDNYRGDEHCAGMYDYTQVGVVELFDTFCSYGRYFVCEKP